MFGPRSAVQRLGRHKGLGSGWRIGIKVAHRKRPEGSELIYRNVREKVKVRFPFSRAHMLHINYALIGARAQVYTLVK